MPIASGRAAPGAAPVVAGLLFANRSAQENWALIGDRWQPVEPMRR